MGISTFLVELALILILATRTTTTQEEDHDSSKDRRDRWELFEFGDQTIPLYYGNSTQEFLKLCQDKSGNDIVTLARGATCDCMANCTEMRLKALKFAKDKIRGLMSHIEHPTRTGLIWSIWVACCIGGIYLNVMGHYQCVNLPIIGNWLLDAPTDGIKFKHYLWMRWIILGDTNYHWKTYMKSNAFIFHWVPLSKLPWSRPPTPDKVRDDEPRDSEHPPWTLEDILAERKIEISKFYLEGALEEGWEKAAKRESQMAKDEGVTAGDENIYGALEDYWIRIYGWAWHRYHYTLDAPHIVSRKKEAKEPSN